MGTFFVYSKSIKVLYPNGGEVFYNNSSIFIRWDSDAVNEKVIIVLYKKGIKYFTISKGCENTGNYLWKIPSNFVTDKNFRLRIRLLSDLSINDFSDRDFSISKKNNSH